VQPKVESKNRLDGGDLARQVPAWRLCVQDSQVGAGEPSSRRLRGCDSKNGQENRDWDASHVHINSIHNFLTGRFRRVCDVEVELRPPDAPPSNSQTGR
jgi:hypothetical protein